MFNHSQFKSIAEIPVDFAAMTSETEARSLANALTDYVKVDMTDGIKAVEESIDDTLTRLDEFTGVMDVLRRETNSEVALLILAKKSELLSLFEKITKLEKIVDTVKHTVENFEQLVTTAENELNTGAEGKILNLIKPFLFKKPAVNRPLAAQNQPKFSSPEIYSTQELFATFKT